jgi:N-glycosylase/DNA lyase
LDVGRLLVQLTKIPAPDFDLAKTLDSGQVFHWEKYGAGFLGTIGKTPIYVEQRGNCLLVSRGSAEIAYDYFALDHPLKNICRSLPRDPAMTAAKEFCRGLRIIRQPKWECLAMFICSSMKQVAHIRQISLALRKRFGGQGKIDGELVYTFPSAQRIARSSEKGLRDCALGYRAKNLLATARLIARGDVDLEKLAALADADLGEALCALPGVGAKVANCVMLFAYERLGAFPIDVWIERVLRENYFPRARKLNARRLQTFTDRYFGDHGGYAQQYLFHYARISSRKPAQRAVPGKMTKARV